MIYLFQGKAAAESPELGMYLALPVAVLQAFCLVGSHDIDTASCSVTSTNNIDSLELLLLFLRKYALHLMPWHQDVLVLHTQLFRKFLALLAGT